MIKIFYNEQFFQIWNTQLNLKVIRNDQTTQVYEEILFLISLLVIESSDLVGDMEQQITGFSPEMEKQLDRT